MPRPTSISDERILSAAHAVFLEKGIRGTTAEVARRAGVAEGSLFNRFKTKEGLFRAAMAWKLGAPAWIEELGGRAADGDPRRLLVDIGHRTLEFFEQLLPVAMMMMSNPSRRGRLLPLTRDGEPGPLQAMRRLADWFGSEMRGGRLRRQDPEVVARCFLGSLWHYVFFEAMVRELPVAPSYCHVPKDDFVRGLVDLLLDGMLPASPATVAPAIAEHVSSRPRAGRRKAR